MSVPDEERLRIAKEIIALLARDETDERILELTRNSDRFCSQGDQEQAFQCCRESYQLARDVGDQYAQGASRLHMGLHYFVFREEEIDRAMDFCEEASRIFYGASKPKAQGIALLAIGRLAQYACKQGKDRWHRAMTTSLKSALIFDREVSDLNETACKLYQDLVDAYSKWQRAQPPPSATTQSPQASSSSGQANAQSARRWVYESEETPRHSESTPVNLKWVILIGVIIFIFITLIFGLLAWRVDNTSLLALGCVIGFVGSVLCTLMVLWSADHLVCSVAADTHAVIQYRTGDLSVIQEGTHWFLPGVERVCAVVPTTQLNLDLFPLELKTKSLVPILVRLKIYYQIVDAVSLIKAIGTNPTRYFLGLPKPLTCQEVQKKIQDKLMVQAKRIIYQDVDSPSAVKILEACGSLKRWVRQDIKLLVSTWGIKVVDFEVEFYVQ